MTAKKFINALNQFISDKEMDKVDRFFKGNDGKTKALGVRFGDVFKTAKLFMAMATEEIEELLKSDYYEVRMGAAAIMDYQAREKSISEAQHKALFDLYIRRHDRLNNWDFPDRAAASVIGGYLDDKPKEILYQLAKSKDIWQRRTAIVATHHFIKKGQLDETYKIAEILIADKNEFINKAVGGWLREAGKKDSSRLKAFLDKHISMMATVTLRYAIEKFDPGTRDFYLKKKAAG
jgi:3-methyladenine DNA glycosylase AlkD